MEGDYLMQAPAQIKHRKAPLKTRLWNYKWFYVMFLPVFVALIVFHYLPMFGISLAFFRYQPSKIANPLEFTGLANFQKLFSRPQFWSSFTNTLEISIIKLLLNTFMAVIISLLLNEMVSTKMKKLSQTIICRTSCRGLLPPASSGCCLRPRPQVLSIRCSSKWG